jgi:hypothetical protein
MNSGLIITVRIDEGLLLFLSKKKQKRIMCDGNGFYVDYCFSPMV